MKLSVLLVLTKTKNTTKKKEKKKKELNEPSQTLIFTAIFD